MLEHQRNILSAMGIDIWIPQATAQTRHYNHPLYRDHSVGDFVHPSVIDVESQFVPDTVETHSKINDSNITPIEKLKQQPEPIQLKNELEDSPQSNIQDGIEVERQIQHIPDFELQALVTKSHVILVDVTQLEAEQEALWSNIQRSISKDLHTLRWPFNLNYFQDGRGCEAYIRGFVDAFSQDRKLVSLGPLSQSQSLEFTTLPSLQEMIAQPVLKRQLWKFINNQ